MKRVCIPNYAMRAALDQIGLEASIIEFERSFGCQFVSIDLSETEIKCAGITFDFFKDVDAELFVLKFL